MRCATVSNCRTFSGLALLFSQPECLINANVRKTERQIMKNYALPYTLAHSLGKLTKQQLKTSYSHTEHRAGEKQQSHSAACFWALLNIKFYEFVRTSFENRKTCKCFEPVYIYMAVWRVPSESCHKQAEKMEKVSCLRRVLLVFYYFFIRV